MKAAQAGRAAADALLAQRKAERMPFVTADGSVGYLSGRPVSPTDALRATPTRRVEGEYYEAAGSAELPVFAEGTLLGQTAVGVKQAQLGLSEQEWRLRSLRTQVALKVAEAYVDVIKNRGAERMQEEILRFTETSYRRALSEFEQNLISRSDLLLAEVRFAEAKRDLAVTRTGVQRARQALLSSMGFQDTQEVEVDQEGAREMPPTPQPIETLMLVARQEHPDIKAQEFKVSRSREEVARVRAELYPTLALRVSYGYVDDFDADGSSQFLAALRLKIPIFDFGRIRAKAAVARAQAEAEESELERLKLKIGQDVADLYYQLQVLDAKIEVGKKQIEQATEALKLNRAMFEQALVPLSVLHESEAAALRLEVAQRGMENDRTLARFSLKLMTGE